MLEISDNSPAIVGGGDVVVKWLEWCWHSLRDSAWEKPGALYLGGCPSFLLLSYSFPHISLQSSFSCRHLLILQNQILPLLRAREQDERRWEECAKGTRINCTSLTISPKAASEYTCKILCQSQHVKGPRHRPGQLGAAQALSQCLDLLSSLSCCFWNLFHVLLLLSLAAMTNSVKDSSRD